MKTTEPSPSNSVSSCASSASGTCACSSSASASSSRCQPTRFQNLLPPHLRRSETHFQKRVLGKTQKGNWERSQWGHRIAALRGLWERVEGDTVRGQ